MRERKGICVAVVFGGGGGVLRVLSEYALTTLCLHVKRSLWRAMSVFQYMIG